MLVIHEIGHILVYFAVVGVVFLKTKKLRISHVAFGFLVTLFMDVDHLFDYFMYKGLTVNFTDFFQADYFSLSGKVFVLLHAWEYVLALSIMYLFLKGKRFAPFLIFAALGIGVHLTYDTLFYGFNPLGYSIIYRILSGFSLTVLHF
jgi:hypothetical protein